MTGSILPMPGAASWRRAGPAGVGVSASGRDHPANRDWRYLQRLDVARSRRDRYR